MRKHLTKAALDPANHSLRSIREQDNQWVQRKWEHYCKSFMDWKRLHSEFTSQGNKDFAMKRMVDIAEEYPQLKREIP